MGKDGAARAPPPPSGAPGAGTGSVCPSVPFPSPPPSPGSGGAGAGRRGAGRVAVEGVVGSSRRRPRLGAGGGVAVGGSASEVWRRVGPSAGPAVSLPSLPTRGTSPPSGAGLWRHPLPGAVAWGRRKGRDPLARIPVVSPGATALPPSVGPAPREGVSRCSCLRGLTVDAFVRETNFKALVKFGLLAGLNSPSVTVLLTSGRSFLETDT